MPESPVLLYSVLLLCESREERVALASSRMRQTARHVQLVKKGIDRTNGKLGLLTAPFPSIQFDSKCLYVHLAKEGSCFSRAGPSKKQKQCQIM